MDNLFAIGLGLGLRALVDVYHDDDKVSGTLVGLWEGLVLGHLLHKHPGSTDPYFALVFRLICDLAVTESFTRLVIVVLWAGLGLVFADILASLSSNSTDRRTSSSSRIPERRISSSRSTRSVISTTTRTDADADGAGGASEAHSSLQWPFFKSLAATRVHFYDLPAAPARARTGSELSTGSDVAPRSILRSPPGSALGVPVRPRRVREDIVPGTWSITESVTEVLGVAVPVAPPAARMATLAESVDEDASTVDEQSALDGGSALSMRTSEMSSALTALSVPQVVRPPTPPLPRAPEEPPTMEDPLAYLDEEDAAEAADAAPRPFPPPPSATPARRNSKRLGLAEPLRVGRVELPPGPMTPTRVPDLRDIPEIQAPPTPGVGAARLRVESMPVRTPALRDIPDMPTPDSPTALRRGASERPLSGPPPYGDFFGPQPPAPPPPPPEKSVFRSDYLPKAPTADDDFPALPPATPRPPRTDGTPVGAGARESTSTTASALLRDAEELRAAAAGKDTEARTLDGALQAATRARRYHDALRHKIAKEEADEAAARALRRAESKLFRAHTKRAGTQSVDVHALRAGEAVRRTEKAIAAAYERGDPALAVVVGPPAPNAAKGADSVKSAVQTALRGHRIPFVFDETDADRLLITLPYPTT